MNTGANRVQENCIFDLFEACRRMVISGNRGFCSRNPGYSPSRKKARRKALATPHRVAAGIDRWLKPLESLR